MATGKSAKARAKKATLRENLVCGCAEGPALAPRGDYDVEHVADAVKLCECATKNRFTLSFDAYLQHLVEGRIALSQG